MADRKVLAARLRQIAKEKGTEISETEAEARIGDKFYAQAFGYGDEITDQELNVLYDIADTLVD